MYKFDARKLLGLFVVSIILCSVFVVAPNLEVSFSNNESVKIMPLGNSITRGGPPFDSPSGFRGFLYWKLTIAGFDVDFVGTQSDGSGFDTDHEGYDGEEAWELNAMLYDLLSANPPDIILYHIGTNDLEGSDIEQYADDANESLRIIYDFDPDITIVLAKIILTDGTLPLQDERTRAYNVLLEGHAQFWDDLGYSIIVVDMENALNYTEDMADQLHPNANGYEKMADVWYDALDDILPLGAFPTGMISYWKLDETSGNIFYDFVGNNDGSSSGSRVPAAVAGIVNGARDFDGVDDYIAVADDPSLDWMSRSNFTMELWANFTNVTGENKVMIGRDEMYGGVHWSLGAFGTDSAFVPGSAFWYLSDTSSDVPNGVLLSGTTALNDSSWHHIVGVRDESTNTNMLYVDGVEVDSEWFDYSAGFDAVTTLDIGNLAYHLTHQFFYDGLLDEVALYNEALPADEILQHYSNGLLGKGYLEGQQVGFDFGTEDSPVEAGYFQVTESTLYSASLSYGWNSTSGLDSLDRGAPDNLRRDFVFNSTEHTFSFDLENGDYQVTVIIGDQDQMRDQIDVYAEDILKINDLTAQAGTFQEVSFGLKVADGQLNITILDDGGTDPCWVINAITIEALGFPLHVGVNPTSGSLVVGQSQLFTATAFGGTPPYSYAWYLDSVLVPGAVDSTWTFTPESAGTYEVYVNVTDNVGDWAQSNTVSITVSSARGDAYLLLSVEPNQAIYPLGESVTFRVNVFSEVDFSEESLTFTVTGPGDYYVFDFERINMTADTVGEYSFDWTVPDVAGTYVVEVGLVPPMLTAYDTVWLEAA